MLYTHVHLHRTELIMNTHDLHVLHVYTYYCVYMYSTGKCVHYTGSTHSYHHSTHICEESLLKHYILGVDFIMLHNGHPLSHANYII